MRVTAFALAAFLALTALSGCDRRVEPFAEGEEPRQPDLSNIFPPGAEQSADEPRRPGMPPAPAESQTASSGAPIRGTVRVSQEVAARLPDDAVLFVIARPGAAGPPLAVLRIASPSFPVEFAIGSENRMIETLPFAGPLRVIARLDRDGNATTRSPGDLQGAADGAFDPGAENVEIVLDEVL
jgi:hypothetical protein